MQSSHRRQSTNTGTTKKRRRSSITFVQCPAGCGKSIADSFINVHLDQCIHRHEKREPVTSPKFRSCSEDPAAVSKSEDYQDVGALTQEALEGADADTQQANDPNDQGTGQSKVLCCTQDVASNETLGEMAAKTHDVSPIDVQPEVRKGASGPADAFARMMEKSKVTFGAGGRGPIQQLLYVDDDGCVALSTGMGRATHDQPIAWSNVVVLKNRCTSESGDESGKRQRRPVELTVATSQSNVELPQMIRLVRHHSRLSVPVLKSILQKSIRRRKPLPAVRVAMELADKSLGDLLRRLPIILLEDSTLHPDLPWLVWVMVAHSKDFVIPRPWLTRLLRIVFEVASCQWVDDPSSLEPVELQPLTFESLVASECADPQSLTMLWSLLVRTEYGGMKCDIDMLVKFTSLWHMRYGSGCIAASVASRIGGDGSSSLSWHDVPTRIHERAKIHSEERVTPLCRHGIDRLQFEDISVEGIDFHCSPLVDHLLTLPLVGLCTDILILGGQEKDIPTTIEARRSWMEGILKHCIWIHSSGVNRRQPLVDNRLCGSEHPSRKYQELWNELIFKEVQLYQISFVRERMAQA